VNLLSLQFLFLQVHNELYPDKNPFRLADGSRIVMFDKVAGSDQVRKLFSRRMAYKDIEGFFTKDCGGIPGSLEKHYLYK